MKRTLLGVLVVAAVLNFLLYNFLSSSLQKQHSEQTPQQDKEHREHIIYEDFRTSQPTQFDISSSLPNDSFIKSVILWPLPKNIEKKNRQIDFGSVELSFGNAVQQHSTQITNFQQSLFESLGIHSKERCATLIIRFEYTDTGRTLYEEVPFGSNEQYTLSVDEVVKVSSDTLFGALHALKTIAQLITVNNESSCFSISSVEIEDEPRFRYRGLLLDTGRAYFSIGFIKRMLYKMSFLKLNVLHWHLTDDQSFSFESKKFPLLHQKGAGWLGYIHNRFRMPTGNYYSQEELQDIVQYAQFLGIRVIPELDMPGHARSWGKGYPQLSAKCDNWIQSKSSGNPKGEYVVNVPLDISLNFTYEVIEGLLSELASIFTDPFIHVGGDEPPEPCWMEDVAMVTRMKEMGIKTSEFTSYFHKRIRSSLRAINKTGIFWDESLAHLIKQRDESQHIVQVWRGDNHLKHAIENNLFAIKSFGYYFDPSAQSCASWKQCYTRDPIPSDSPLTPSQLESLVLGGEGCAWELTEMPSTSIEKGVVKQRGFDDLVWSKLTALAENLWSAKDARSLTLQEVSLETAHHSALWRVQQLNSNGNNCTLEIGKSMC